MRCGGSISASARRSAPFVPGTDGFSAPIPPRSLVRGRIAHIAEVTARDDSNLSLSAPRAIDPSVILTGLYSGVTLTSAGGQNCVTPVPLPGTARRLSPAAFGPDQGGRVAETGWKQLRRQGPDRKGCFVCPNR
ncbi:MAG: hypothetical protein ACYDHY_16305 [Acidiferrobacterales bacterium]